MKSWTLICNTTSTSSSNWHQFDYSHTLTAICTVAFIAKAVSWSICEFKIWLWLLVYVAFWVGRCLTKYSFSKLSNQNKSAHKERGIKEKGLAHPVYYTQCKRNTKLDLQMCMIWPHTVALRGISLLYDEHKHCNLIWDILMYTILHLLTRLDIVSTADVYLHAGLLINSSI